MSENEVTEAALRDAMERLVLLLKERDAARAEVVKAEADAYNRTQALAAVCSVLAGLDVPSQWDFYGAVQDARAARAEVERLRREYDVRAVIERCPQHDAPTLVDGYQKGRVRIVCSECCDEDNERLREALRGLLDAEPVAHHADLCDVVPCHECRARAALAGAPSERIVHLSRVPFVALCGADKRDQTTIESDDPSDTTCQPCRDRALAERVRERIAQACDAANCSPEIARRVRALDLDALLSPSEFRMGAGVPIRETDVKP